MNIPFVVVIRGKGNLQQLIADKSRNVALHVRGGREEIQNVSIATSHFPGEALPITPTSITLIILEVNGLKIWELIFEAEDGTAEALFEWVREGNAPRGL